MKYWSLSCILQKQIDHELVDTQYQKILKTVQWSGVGFIVLVAGSFSWAVYFGEPMPQLYFLMPLIWIPSLVFLLVGLHKIQSVMQNLRDCIKVPGAFLLYCLMAVLAILGEIPLLVSGLLGDYPKTQGYTDYLLAENVIIFAY